MSDEQKHGNSSSQWHIQSASENTLLLHQEFSASQYTVQSST